MPKRTPEYMAAQRDRILKVALECFAEKGLHQTSTDDIARVAGCGKSAIYAHFASKRAMIEALTERELELYETSGPRDMTQLKQYLADSFEHLHTPRMRQFSRLTMHMAAESLADPEFLDWERRLFNRYLAWIAPLVRSDPAAAGLSNAQVRDAARRLIFFWAGQGLYKMLMPDLPAAQLRADTAAVVTAIIASARQESSKRGRRKLTGKRSVTSRRKAVTERQAHGTKRRARADAARR